MNSLGKLIVRQVDNGVELIQCGSGSHYGELVAFFTKRHLSEAFACATTLADSCGAQVVDETTPTLH